MDLTPYFWQGLSHSKGAMHTYASLTKGEKRDLLKRVELCPTLRDVHILISSLEERETLNEFY